MSSTSSAEPLTLPQMLAALPSGLYGPGAAPTPHSGYALAEQR